MIKRLSISRPGRASQSASRVILRESYVGLLMQGASLIPVVVFLLSLLLVLDSGR